MSQDRERMGRESAGSTSNSDGPGKVSPELSKAWAQ